MNIAVKGRGANGNGDTKRTKTGISKANTCERRQASIHVAKTLILKGDAIATVLQQIMSENFRRHDRWHAGNDQLNSDISNQQINARFGCSVSIHPRLAGNQPTGIHILSVYQVFFYGRSTLVC
jgi:hypothetical protein